MIITKEMNLVAGRYYIGIDNESIKIPYRYNRVMCFVDGIKPLQELRVGDSVDAEITLKVHDGQVFKVLKSIIT
jgi:hypothetical protein